MNATKIAAVVLTLNESEFIESCLQHLKPYIDYVLVLDGESTDNTVDIAIKYADMLLKRPFSGSYAEECNYAQDSLPPQYKWVLMCDADERFPIPFLKDIHKIVDAFNVECFRFPRVNQDKTYAERLLLNPQDHQVRLYKRLNCRWTRQVHSILWHTKAGKRADQHSVHELPQYPILHLARPPEIRKTIQARWDNLEKQKPLGEKKPYFYKINI